jgi:DNA-binding NarL/FixJ family response regulator
MRIEEMARILVVDGQSHIRQGLVMRLALEPDLEVVGEAENGQRALEMAENLRPDLILLALEMPEVDGLALASRLHDCLPQSMIVVLSLQEGEGIRQQVQQAGATALVSKREMDHVLIHTIQTVMRKM